VAWTLPGYRIERIAFPAQGAIGQYNDVLPVLADGDGSLLQLDSSGRLLVSVAVAAGLYAEDTPHVSGDLGVEMLTRRADTPSSSAGADGDYATLNTDGDGYLYAIDKAYDAPTGANKNLPVTDLAARRIDVAVPLLTAPLTIDDTDFFPIEDTKTAYAIDVRGYTRISLMCSIVFGSPGPENIRVKMVAMTAPGGTQYNVPILKPDTGGTPYCIKTEAEYIEFNLDDTQDMVLTWDLSNTLPYVMFMVCAGTPFDDPDQATIDCSYTLGWGS